MEKVRPVFIYLTIIAVIFGVVGVLIMARNFTGHILAGGESYDKEEIAKHNSKQDCWISLDGKVYDITLFLQIYPEDLSGKCGKDVELKDFSSDVLEALKQYQIGFVE